MNNVHAVKHFVDLSGRAWEIRELSAGEAREIFPNELFFEQVSALLRARALPPT